MTAVLMIVGVSLVLYAVMMSVAGHIPKRGRCLDADDSEIMATITNSNKVAERFSTIRAVDDSGRKYAAKLRQTEAKYWIKGDKIKISLTKDKKKYRIHFHEYFKINEDRIRQEVLERLEKEVKPHSIAAKMTGYKKESLEALRASKADSLTLFAYMTYMKSIDKYFIIAVVVAVLFVLFLFKQNLQMFELLIPLIIVIGMFLSISSLAKLCAKIYKRETDKNS